MQFLPVITSLVKTDIRYCRNKKSIIKFFQILLPTKQEFATDNKNQLTILLPQLEDPWHRSRLCMHMNLIKMYFFSRKCNFQGLIYSNGHTYLHLPVQSKIFTLFKTNAPCASSFPLYFPKSSKNIFTLLQFSAVLDSFSFCFHTV